jgi:uncharacterized membrane protein
LKVKLSIGILIVDILTILLVLSIFQINSAAIRIVLGIPFLLFFPGYTLIAVMFPGSKNGIDSAERIALSFAMSLVITALIGFGLNFTTWGIRLEPVLYSISAFIIVVSIIALFRNKSSLEADLKELTKFRLGLPGREENTFNFVVTIFLLLAIAGSIAALGYTITKPKIGEQFTDFYILGNTGKAESYPSDFIFTQDKVTRVSYDEGISFLNSDSGEVTLVISNQEKQETFYEVILHIDGQAVSIHKGGQVFDKLENIRLQPEEKWEEKIRFAPQHPGDSQKVEFLLFKNGAVIIENELYLWVNAIEK